jgi:mRNA interferase MazF
LSNSSVFPPRRGEIWLVNLDPTVPIKLVAPVTDWKEYFGKNVWHVGLDPDSTNGLVKTSAVDALQLRSLDHQRFIRRLGRLSGVKLEEVVIAVAAVIEYQ